MRFNISQPELATALQTVTRAVGARGGMEVLSGVLVSAGEDGVMLGATDGDFSLQSSLGVSVEEPGSVVVPGRLLADVVRSLGAHRVGFEHRGGQEAATIATERSRFALRVLRHADFPHLPVTPSDGRLVVPAGPLAATANRVVCAASRDETRPVLTGILMSVADTTLRMVATDSYRLSVRETSVESGIKGSLEANVPARVVREVSRLVGESSGEPVVVAAQEGQVIFDLGSTTVASRLIDGQFPDYKQLLPDSYDHELRLAREELLGVVQRVGLMAQRSAPLRLVFDSGSVTVSAETPDVGEGTETIPIEFSGDRLEIGFNPRFLQDGLESAEAEEITLRLISPLRPGLIEAHEENGDGRFLYLIMPVRLNV